MEIDYNDSNKYFDSSFVSYSINKSRSVSAHFYVKRDNENGQNTEFIDIERLAFRLSQGMVQTIKDFGKSNYEKLKITLKLE